jgi:hypothetical protein
MQMMFARFQAAADALKWATAAVGKETLRRRYNNEAKMMIYVLFGIFGSINRSRLLVADLKALEETERKKTFLLARNQQYKDRKIKPKLFAGEIRGSGLACSKLCRA